MSNELLEKQFSVDFSCEERDLNKNIFVTNDSNLETRYWARGKGSLVCYKDQIYVRTENETLTAELKEMYHETRADWFFEMDNLEKIETLLKKYQLKITRLAPFFIPKKTLEISVAEDDNYIFLTQEKIKAFQQDTRITEAFCYSETDPDQLGLGYYQAGELKAVCGANQIGKYTWELGIEILDPEVKGRGIASTLIQNITAKIQKDHPNIIPIYGTAFSHTKSMNVAINAGFKLGFSELLIGKE